MDSSRTDWKKELHVVMDPTTEEDYARQSKLLKEFISIPSIDKAWIFNSDSGPQAMFALSQANLLANKKRKFMLSGHISNDSNQSVNFKWAPFPIEMTGASAFVPSPSGLKLLIVKNPENESPTKFEIWNSTHLEKEFHIPRKVHGSVYVDGWFEGISWNSDETRVAYVAEEPSLPKPTFDDLGYYKEGNSLDNDIGSWKGQGDWEEEWGEAYAKKRQPALFVIDVDSGDVKPIEGIPRSISVGQVVWSPNSNGSAPYLVFAGWLGDKRKFGIKYCDNRPCAIYAIKFVADQQKGDANKFPIVTLTKSISSGFCPRFSKDGKFLLFVSTKCAVDTGAHRASESLHRLDWPSDGKLSEATNIIDVTQVVNCPEDGDFPGLYGTGLLSDPWLSDGHSLLLSTYWHSCRVILNINMLSGEVSRATPSDSDYSWSILALDGDNIVAVSSSPVSVPEIKYGKKGLDSVGKPSWQWSNIQSPISYSEKVMSGLSSLQFKILKVPISNVSEGLAEGAKKPFEAIYISSSKSKETGICDPLIAVLHGGPHSIIPCSFARNLAYLSSIGYSQLIINYRGTLGFGEDAVQSLPGKVGSQDVKDVLTAIDHAIEMGLADPSKIFVLGGSHGGFLTTHLIGQAPGKFVAAAARNPVCNLASMVGITDIPDWCFFEAYGDHTHYTEAPSPEDLYRFHQMSPISHISKVKTPTLFLLGTQDLRVPISNGLQYVRALKEKGAEVKVLVFPNDNHSLDRRQTEFESYLNIAVWFNKYSKQ